MPKRNNKDILIKFLYLIPDELTEYLKFINKTMRV